MPRRPIASENKVGAGGNRFPKLAFKDKGERKRILLIDPEGPWQEYVHYLRAPKFKDGAPVMTTRERRGEEVPDYDTDFIGQPLCHGDTSVIEELGLDIANCFACQEAKDAPAEARLAPQLRFAANVVDQELKPNSWDIRRPYSAAIVIWNFTSGMYDEIISLQEQHGKLIRTRDISLECSNPRFNQVKMSAMPNAGWEEANAGAYLKELLEEPGNVATDEQLKDSCGRTVKRSFLEEDVKLCVKRWKRAVEYNGTEEFGDSSAGTQLGGQRQDLASAAKDLLGDDEKASAAGNGSSADPWSEERTAKAVEEVKAAKAEVQAQMAAERDGLDVFTPGGEDRVREEAAQAAAAKHGEGADPFASTSTPAAAPAAQADASPGLSTDSTAGSPATQAQPASEPRKSSFDQLYQDLMHGDDIPHGRGGLGG